MLRSIADALQAAGGDVNIAAVELKVSASTLYRKIKNFDLDAEA